MAEGPGQGRQQHSCPRAEYRQRRWSMLKAFPCCKREQQHKDFQRDETVGANPAPPGDRAVIASFEDDAGEDQASQWTSEAGRERERNRSRVSSKRKRRKPPGIESALVLKRNSLRSASDSRAAFVGPKGSRGGGPGHHTGDQVLDTSCRPPCHCSRTTVQSADSNGTADSLTEGGKPGDLREFPTIARFRPPTSPVQRPSSSRITLPPAGTMGMGRPRRSTKVVVRSRPRRA